jgi:CHAT domain
MSKDISVTKILFLASNPKGMDKLRLDEEARDVKEGLRQSKDKEWFTIESQWAVRPRDIRREILYSKPNIVHFSGHGSEDGGLAFENEVGQVQLVSPDALSGLFKLFSEHVKCVVLNACYSEIQAEAIAQHISFVVGMRKDIGDQAAIEFSVGFYDALGAGCSVESAYEFGCNAIHIAGIEESLTPVLKKKGDLESYEETIPMHIEGRNIFRSQAKRLNTRIATLASVKVEYEFVLSGHIDEVTKPKLEAIVNHLREVTGDTTLTFLKVESGSIKVTVEGTQKGFSTLESLIASGQLKQVGGFSVQEVRRINLNKSKSSSSLIKTGDFYDGLLDTPDDLLRPLSNEAASSFLESVGVVDNNITYEKLKKSLRDITKPLDHEIQSLDRQFKRAFDEIDLLQNKIAQERGFLFVRYHTFSQEKLLQSRHHQIIYSVVETIGSNVKNWEAANKISERMADAYYIRRAETDRKLHQLNLTISHREPTWWENFGFVCEKFKDDVMSHLPEEVRGVIQTAAKERLGGVFQSLFGIFPSFLNGRSEQNLLSKSRDDQDH